MFEKRILSNSLIIKIRSQEIRYMKSDKKRLNALQIGELIAEKPIIQGGMGVGVSRSSLAGAVAAEGGVGTVSYTHLAARSL